MFATFVAIFVTTCTVVITLQFDERNKFATCFAIFVTITCTVVFLIQEYGSTIHLRPQKVKNH